MNWKRKVEICAFPGFRFQPDFAPELIDKAKTDGKAQSNSVVSYCFRIIGAVEAVENFCLLFFCDANTGIFYEKQEVLFASGVTEFNFPFLGVFYCVINSTLTD
jgi:hypothetical protein